jgi:hypothetical protein
MTDETTASDHWLKGSILAEKAELLMQPPSFDRDEDLAACDRLLERLERLIEADAAGLPRKPLTEKQRKACELICAVLDRLPPAEART